VLSGRSCTAKSLATLVAVAVLAATLAEFARSPKTLWPPLPPWWGGHSFTVHSRRAPLNWRSLSESLGFVTNIPRMFDMSADDMGWLIAVIVAIALLAIVVGAHWFWR
jgi:hypothetical protein